MAWKCGGGIKCKDYSAANFSLYFTVLVKFQECCRNLDISYCVAISHIFLSTNTRE